MPAKKRDYKKEYEQYHGTPEQIKRRSGRNQARQKLEDAGRVKPGDGKDVDHKNGNPNDNRPSNLRVTTQKTNRGTRNKKK